MGGALTALARSLSEPSGGRNPTLVVQGSRVGSGSSPGRGAASRPAPERWLGADFVQRGPPGNPAAPVRTRHRDFRV